MAYLAALIKWNKTYNLTAITAPDQMVTDHILDALTVLPYVAESRRLIDVGTGGGIPGMILAICLPETAVTLLDSNSKKTTFLRQAVIELGLGNVNVVHCRAESLKEVGFDAIVSRAFSAVSSFVTLTSHLVADNGKWYAMKGNLQENEIAELGPAYSIAETVRLTVPGSEANRHLLIIRKNI